MAQFEQWAGFTGRNWQKSVDVRDFIQNNYTPYDGDESFLADPTEATNKLWGRLQELQKEERAKGGVLDMEHTLYLGAMCVGSVSVNNKGTVGNDNLCAVHGCDLDAFPLGIGEGTAVKHYFALKSAGIDAGSLVVVPNRICKVYVLEANVCGGCNVYFLGADNGIAVADNFHITAEGNCGCQSNVAAKTNVLTICECLLE